MSKVNKAQIALLGKIDASITALQASEKITKSELGVVSRNILEYLMLNGSTDIDCVNRLLAALTPMNRQTAVLFFNHFLYWAYDKETEAFTNMEKGEKKQDKYRAKVTTFMADKNNNIWTWAKANTEIKPLKPFDERIAHAIKQALKGIDEKDGRPGLEPLPVSEILQAVIQGGVSMGDMMALVDTITVPDDTPSAEVIAINGDATAEETAH